MKKCKKQKTNKLIIINVYEYFRENILHCVVEQYYFL